MVVVGNARQEASRQSDENYLKAILLLHIDLGRAFVSDLAETMGVALTTAYSSVNRLVDAGFVVPLERRGGRKSNKQTIQLTPKGQEIASRLLEKHQQIQQWLVLLGVPADEADEEACHWEHSITPRTMEILRRHVDFATRIRGGTSSAREAIVQLSRQFSPADNAPRTAVSSLVDLVDRCGGAEGIRTKETLSRQVGGDEQLTRLVDLALDLGGVDRLCGHQEAIRTVLDHGETVPGSLADSLRVVQALGDEEDLRRLCTLSRQLGGMKTLLRIVSAEAGLWRDVHFSDREDP